MAALPLGSRVAEIRKLIKASALVRVLLRYWLNYSIYAFQGHCKDGCCTAVELIPRNESAYARWSLPIHTFSSNTDSINPQPAFEK